MKEYQGKNYRKKRRIDIFKVKEAMKFRNERRIGMNEE